MTPAQAKQLTFARLSFYLMYEMVVYMRIGKSLQMWSEPFKKWMPLKLSLNEVKEKGRPLEFIEAVLLMPHSW